MKLVIDISEEDYEKIKKTSFVENTETLFKQSTEDRKGTLMLFRVLDSIKNGEPQKRGKWIFKAFDEETGISDSYWCSECNRPLASAYNDYCSNCGSYNAENKENEND